MASFRCYDKSDVIATLILTNFHLYISYTTVVAIFPHLCLWRRSLCSNMGGIDPEKLYRATLNNHRRSKRFHWDRSLVKKRHWNEFPPFLFITRGKDFIQLKMLQLGRSNWFNRCLRIFGSFFEYFQSLKLGIYFKLWKLHGKILDLGVVEIENMKGIISRQITDSHYEMPPA